MEIAVKVYLYVSTSRCILCKRYLFCVGEKISCQITYPENILFLSHNFIKDSYFTYAFVMMSATGKRASENIASPATTPRKVRKIKMSCKGAIKRSPPKQGVKVPLQGWELFFKQMDEEMEKLKKTAVSVENITNKEQKEKLNLFVSDTEELFGSDDSDTD